MNRQEAEALTRFVNDGNARYRAEALPLGDTVTWVLLTDRHTHYSGPAPIVNVREYLERDGGGLSPECRRLLEAWLAEATLRGGAEA